LIQTGVGMRVPGTGVLSLGVVVAIWAIGALNRE